jgi:hypothetical protein
MWKREKEENRGSPSYSTSIDKKECACILGPIIGMLCVIKL